VYPRNSTLQHCFAPQKYIFSQKTPNHHMKKFAKIATSPSMLIFLLALLSFCFVFSSCSDIYFLPIYEFLAIFVL